jgi:hypothetical protein
MAESPAPAPGPLMHQHQAHHQAIPPSPPSMPQPQPFAVPPNEPITTAIINTPCTPCTRSRSPSATAPTASNSPPVCPSFKGLSVPDRNAVKRAFEKVMYEWMCQNGTPTEEGEVCGPCERTGSACIRLPAMRKCAVCYRGHDVCEMWDETVQNLGRRRLNPKNQKTDEKREKKKVRIVSVG